MTTGQATPGLALAAYAETWITGAKVVVFGNALSPLAQRLVERGARLVYVYDTDSGRVSEATARGSASQISFAPLSQAGSAVRDGVFDVGIVEDITQARESASEVVSRLRRALSPRGTAIVATRNPQAQRFLVPSEHPVQREVSYYDLYDAVSAEFEEVRMCGQTPFVGYAVADFGATEDPEVQVDTAFLSDGAEEPEWFFALASQQAEPTGAFCVIQLPFAEVGSASEPEGTSSSAELGVEGLRTELEQREEWLVGAEARAAAADERSDAVQAELDRQTEEAETLKRALARTRKELGEAEKRGDQNRKNAGAAEVARREQDEHQRNTAQLQNNAAQLELKASQLRSTVSELEATVKELEATVAQLEESNDRADQKVSRLTASVNNAELRATQAEAALGGAEKLAARAQAGIDSADQRADHRAAEAQASLDAAQRRTLELEKALAAANQQLDVVQQSADVAERSGQLANSKLLELQIALDEEKHHRKEAEARVGAQSGQAESADRAKLALEKEKQGLVADLTQLKGQLERGAADEKRRLTDQRKLETVSRKLKNSEATVKSLEDKLQAAESSLSDSEWQAAEERLRERGQAILKLQRELESTERLGKELLVELEELRSAQSEGAPPEEDSKLRSSNARLTADLEAAQWTIEALEGRLSSSSPGE